jgi:hypothetical protein
MFPVEAAPTDGHRIRAEYGTRVSMRGRFIPYMERAVPPDVSRESCA